MRRIAAALLVAAAPVITGGQPAGRPAAPAVTRAEFAAMVSDHFRWVHWSEYNDYAKAVPRQFSDVPSTHRFARQVECALEERIIAPDEDNRFHPDRAVTRAEAVVILARAFKLAPPAGDRLAEYADAAGIAGEARDVWNAVVAGGYLKTAGRRLNPGGTLTRAEAAAMLRAVAAAQVAPVGAMPKAGTTSHRRYVNLSTPTPGAAIFYTVTSDRSEPPDPLAAGKPYDPANGFLLLDNPNGSNADSRVWTIKAAAKKDGMAPSAVSTFVYYIVRPRSAAFEARLVHAPTPTSPAVWDIMNPSDYNRPHVYYIEGTARGVVMDAGQYPESKQNLKLFIDTLATRPYDVVLGHNHPDHAEQIDAFVKAGVRLYMTPQDRASVAASKRPDFAHAAAAAVLIRDGDVLDLGNVRLHAYQAPGHAHGQVILQEKRNGWIFASDMFGCNRPATADITNYSGMKMDVFLSMVQQLYASLRREGGRIEEVYNAHNEVPVGMAGLKNFEAAVQQLIDVGDSVTVPSLRSADPGGRPMGRQRTSVVGAMWRDKNWIAIWVGGNWGEPVNYLTPAHPPYPCNNTIDYNAPGGIRRYSVLSNVEFEGGDLAGVDLTWAPPSNGVANSLPGKFDPWTFAYDGKVPPGQTSITITPTPMSGKITSMKLNGAPIRPKSPQTIAVAAGARIRIEIVAPDGVTSSSYVFTVRQP
jgi:glyoxylase-like metal-dependent hydrolase (beta-lactamase superfamily II)